MESPCFERSSDQLMYSTYKYVAPSRIIVPHFASSLIPPPLSLPVRYCTRRPAVIPKGHRSLLGQAFTASGLSFHHVSSSALFSASLSPGPEANVCLILPRHSQQSRHTDLIFHFASSSQIGKVRQASKSILPNTASLSTTCADLHLLVLLPRRIHDVVVRSYLNPFRGGLPLFL